MAIKRGGIDYSKWDNFDNGDSDDDDSNDADVDCQARVTRLDAPSRVTRNTDGTIRIVPPKSQEADDTSKQREFTGGGGTTTTKVGTSAADSTMSSDTVRKLTKNGGEYRDPTTNMTTYWSQDRHEVILSLLILPSTNKNISVQVTGALPYCHRFSAHGESCGTLVISADNKMEVLLQGDLPHFIHSNQDDDEDIDWVIDTMDNNHKIVSVPLKKAVPMQGMTIWWTRPLMHFPEISVEHIHERTRGRSGESTITSRQAKMKAAWEEAHVSFRQKRKEREPFFIEVDNRNGNIDDDDGKDDSNEVAFHKKFNFDIYCER